VTTLASRVREHALCVSADQLERVSGRLSRLSPEQKSVVADVALALAGAIAESLLEEARQDRRLAVALESIYGHPAPLRRAAQLPSHRSRKAVGGGRVTAPLAPAL
jgi:hypothetical protein